MNSRLTLAVMLPLAIVCAATAAAGLPDPPRSTIQSTFLQVEGATNGIPDNCADGLCATWVVQVRDFANNPVPGSTVVIDFGACTDIQIACDQLTAVTGQTYIGSKRVAGTTDALGRFTFQIQGASNATPMDGNVSSPGTNVGVPCALIYTDGVPLASLKVAAYDLNGLGSPAGAVNGNDVSLAAAEYVKIPLGAQARARMDYNNSGSVTGADVAMLSHMATQAAIGTGSQNTGSYCP